jgi:hypothetical protein
MTNLTEFNDGGGTVTLRGIVVPLDGDVARVFVTDCVKFIEGLLTEDQLRKKYQLSEPPVAARGFSFDANSPSVRHKWASQGTH